MARRRTKKEIESWTEEEHRGRTFVRSIVSRGLNEDLPYTVARRIAERYEVKRFFHAGGFGLLLTARDRHTDTDVLVKATLRYDCAIHARFRDKDGFTRQVWALRQQLQTERRLLVLLRNAGCNAVPHPNDYVFDWNPALAGPYPTEDGKKWRFDDEAILSTEPYLVLEELHGDNLEEVLKAHRDGLDEERALALLRPIAGVLAVLHRPWTMAGGATWRIVYQDLKPANVLVGDHDRAVLLDMGGCRVLVNGQVAQAGANTPGYCPPECEMDGVPLSPAADCYAFGATLYHLLTGQAPADLLPAALAAGSRAVSPERWDWARLGRRASASVVKLVRRCLHPTVGERPAGGAELVEALG